MQEGVARGDDIEDKPKRSAAGSVGWIIGPNTKRLWVRSPVRVHTGGNQSSFLSPSFSPKSIHTSSSGDIKKIKIKEWTAFSKNGQKSIPGFTNQKNSREFLKLAVRVNVNKKPLEVSVG